MGMSLDALLQCAPCGKTVLMKQVFIFLQGQTCASGLLRLFYFYINIYMNTYILDRYHCLRRFLSCLIASSVHSCFLLKQQVFSLLRVLYY